MYHIIRLNTERCHIFLLLNHRRCQIVNSTKISWEKLSHHFAVATQRKHFIWDISLHQHISNLLSYKGGQYNTFTSSCRDCFTVLMKLVSLPLICIQSGTEIIIHSHPNLPQFLKVYLMHTAIVHD